MTIDEIKKYLEEKLSPIIDYLHEKENYVFFITSNDEIGLDIKYPKKVVTNENNDTITIYDFILHLTFSLRSDDVMLINLSGARGALTQAQYNAGYLFSHCSHGISDRARFCFGSGPLDAHVSQLFSMNYSILTDGKLRKFEQFLILFDAYLEVESLEGGPYIKMSSVNTSNKVLFNHNVVSFGEINNFMIYYFNKEDFTFVKNSDIYSVKITDSGIEKLSKQFTNYLVFSENEQEYTPVKNNNSTAPETFSALYSFGGKANRIKVVKEEEKEEKELSLFFSIKLKNNLEATLTDKFNRFLHHTYLKKFL